MIKAFISFAVLTVCSPLIAADNNDQEMLLTALRDTRIAGAGVIVSGRGVAELEGKESLASETEEAIIPRHRVEFVFNGSDSMWREYDPKDNSKLVAATFDKNGRRISYAAATPGVPQSILITSRNKKLALLDNIPSAMSYRELSRIPGPFGDEQQFFTRDVRQSFVNAAKDGSDILIVFDLPIDGKKSEGINQQKVTIRFDMSCGGLVTNYELISDTGQKETRYREVDTLAMKWRRDGSVFLPVSRVAEGHSEMGGKRAGDSSSRIDFKEFTQGPVKEADFDIRAWKVPDGIIIQDEIIGQQYRYSDAIVDKMLGTNSTTKPDASQKAKGDERQ